MVCAVICPYATKTVRFCAKINKLLICMSKTSVIDVYIAFLGEHLDPWFLTFKEIIIFMQDNAPSHAMH